MSNKLQQGTTSAGVFSVCPDRRFALSEGMDMDLVKKRKEELGLTNKDIAAALKIDVSAVSKLLSGKRQLKANEAQILADLLKIDAIRSEEHTSELQSLMRISYAVFCLKKKNNKQHKHIHQSQPKNNSTNNT